MKKEVVSILNVFLILIFNSPSFAAAPTNLAVIPYCSLGLSKASLSWSGLSNTDGKFSVFIFKSGVSGYWQKQVIGNGVIAPDGFTHNVTGARLTFEKGQSYSVSVWNGTSSPSFNFTTSTCQALGEQRVAVVLIDYMNDGQEPSAATYQKEFFGPSDSTPDISANAFIKEASYNKAWVTGRVYGWYHFTRTDAQQSCWASDQEEFFRPDIPYQNYDHLIFVVRGSKFFNETTKKYEDCSGYGVSSMGREKFTTIQGPVVASEITITLYNLFTGSFSGTSTPVTMAHELLHSLGGFGHAGVYECGSNILSSNTNECKQIHGDIFDIMGYRWNAAHPNGAFKEVLGWLAPQNISTVQQTGWYTIYPYETATDKSQAIKIPLPIPIQLNTVDPAADVELTYLYLEYRKPIGFDAGLGRLSTVATGEHPAIDIDGLLVRGAQFYNGIASNMKLLDMKPESIVYPDYPLMDYQDAFLLPNQVFYNAENKIGIRPEEIQSDGGMKLQIGIGVETPVTPPQISSSCQTGDAKADLSWGGTPDRDRSFWVAIRKNGEKNQYLKQVFQASVTAPSGFVDSQGKPLQLEPGSNYQVSISNGMMSPWVSFTVAADNHCRPSAPVVIGEVWLGSFQATSTWKGYPSPADQTFLVQLQKDSDPTVYSKRVTTSSTSLSSGLKDAASVAFPGFVPGQKYFTNVSNDFVSPSTEFAVPSLVPASAPGAGTPYFEAGVLKEKLYWYGQPYVDGTFLVKVQKLGSATIWQKLVSATMAVAPDGFMDVVTGLAFSGFEMGKTYSAVVWNGIDSAKGTFTTPTKLFSIDSPLSSLIQPRSGLFIGGRQLASLPRGYLNISGTPDNGLTFSGMVFPDASKHWVYPVQSSYLNNANTLNFLVSAKDQYNTTVYQELVKYKIENHAPNSMTVSFPEIPEGRSWTYQLNPTDPDNDVLICSLLTPVPGLEVSPSCTMSWTPGFDQAGIYLISVMASDGTFSGTVTGSITVVGVNRPPATQLVDFPKIQKGATFQYQLSSVDPDGDFLTYTLASPIPGLSLSSSGLLSGTPTQAGTYAVRVNVSDGQLNALISGDLTVNTVPVFTSPNFQSVSIVQGAPWTTNFIATDADKNMVTLNATSLPTGATFTVGSSLAGSTVGSFSWDTAQANLGTQQAVVTATDSNGASTTKTLSFTIVAPSSQPPVFNSANSATVKVGQQLDFRVLVSDPENDLVGISVSNLPRGAGYSYTMNVLSFKPTSEQVGTHQVTLSATDYKSIPTKQVLTIQVTP